MLMTLPLCVLYGSRNKQQTFFPYTILTDWNFITEVVSVYSAVRNESLYNTDTFRLWRVDIYRVLVRIIYSFPFLRGIGRHPNSVLWLSTIRGSDIDNGIFDYVVKGVRSDFKLEYSLKYKFSMAPYNCFPTSDTFFFGHYSIFIRASLRG